MDSTTILTLVTGMLLGVALGVIWARSRAAVDLARTSAERDAARQRVTEISGDRSALATQLEGLTGSAVVKDSLDRLHVQLGELERSRVSWQSQLRQQVDDVRATGELLRRETAALSTALRKPQVRGRWGELHLKRAVELAGLVERCDFATQQTHRNDDGTLRPDLVVHLAGGKQVVVDAKVPLDAFLDATSCDDAGTREQHLQRHARQLRQHIDSLGAKSYWQRLAASPEFVVLFVPAEAFLSHALEASPDLIEYAAGKQVILATPTTLIALLRTVAHAWTQEALADNAREVHALGRELYERLSTVGEHLDKLGRSLTSSVKAYNQAIGSIETRVLVSARRLRDLEVSDAPLTSAQPVAEAIRSPAAAELLVADAVPALGRVRPVPAQPQEPEGNRAVGE
ncbi:MAG TPA: DNA recombination protein RmuC [Nocardioidaceae bacterium]|nr:DNA recombination protein RmuC [Nocardioidaceae bacterium]